MTYVYSLVRCVPNPATGEFVNIGAIAGEAASGDWAIRQVGNERRARAFASDVELGAVHSFMARIGARLDAVSALGDDGFDHPSDSWLTDIHREHRNVVQISPPTPIIADSAEQALDIVFDHAIIDPVSQERGFTSKSRVFSELQKSYRTRLPRDQVFYRPALFVGESTHFQLDFAVGLKTVVQLSQTWSFQVGRVDNPSLQVKAWGYAVGRLRAGIPGRLDVGPHLLPVDGSAIDISVGVAPPRTKVQEDAFAEAQEVFDSVGANVVDLEEVDAIGQRAEWLLTATV